MILFKRNSMAEAMRKAKERNNEGIDLINKVEEKISGPTTYRAMPSLILDRRIQRQPECFILKTRKAYKFETGKYRIFKLSSKWQDEIARSWRETREGVELCIANNAWIFMSRGCDENRKQKGSTGVRVCNLNNYSGIDVRVNKYKLVPD